MNRMVNYLAWLGLLYPLGCVAYVGYACYSYTGPYRLAAEWQMSEFGEYSIKITLLLSFLAVTLPAGLVFKLLRSGREASYAAAQLRAWESFVGAVTSPRVILVVGLVLLAVGAGSEWYLYSANISFEPFDLSNSKVPPSNHVAMTGVAHTEYQVEFQRKGFQWTSLDRYVPITAANWRHGDPLVYFMKTNATAYMPPEGGKFEFSQKTPPFPMTTQPGVLIENDLPGPVAAIYHKHNVALAPVPVVLDFRSYEDVEPAAAGGVFFGFCCLLTAAIMMAIHRWRLAQT